MNIFIYFKALSVVSHRLFGIQYLPTWRVLTCMDGSVCGELGNTVDAAGPF